MRRRYANFKRRRQIRKGYHVRRTVYINNPDGNSQIRSVSNYISTTRYNVLTFLPKNLWEQMHRVSNVFYVFVMILTLTPVSPVIAGPTIAAVAAVFLFQMAKDIWEDSKRYKSDKEINSRVVTVIRSHNEEEEIRWRDLQVGDIVRVNNNHEIPADLLLLSSSRDDGQCFVETANLDGESNLKLRSAHPQTASYRTPAELHSLQLEVDVDEPNPKIYEFDGSIVVSKEEELPLTIDNFLHRGIVVRHTDYVFGLVLYTGHQTKYMMNTTRPHMKRTRLERYVNFFMAILIAGLVSICILSAVLGTVVYQYDVALDQWYIIFPNESGEVGDTFKDILTFVVVYSHFIPLTLYVKLEIVRFVQARIMEYDICLYSKDKDAPLEVRASNLMEDLGQIGYIFSDKTGTLTKNEMVFRVCSIGDRTYGSIPDHQVNKFDEDEYLSHLKDDDVEMKSLEEREEEKGSFDAELESQLRSSMKEMKGRLQIDKGEREKGKERERDESGSKGEEEVIVEGDDVAHDSPHTPEFFFFLGLALCNTVIPSTINGKVVFQSSSPDEIALVLGAKRAGFELKSRNVDECEVSIFGEPFLFEMLAVNEFTSERRCMSVVVRFPDGSIYLFMKGADEAVTALASNGEQAEGNAARSAADSFAVKGLRTLLIGKRRISAKEFDEWADDHWNTARLATENRKALLLEAAKFIEKDIEVVGTSGVEDCLQDAVSETIADLMEAGIKIWVVTGDKSQTALNIAESCSLILPSFHVIRVKAEFKDDLHVVTPQIQEGLSHSQSKDCALLIDGRAIDLIAKSDDKDDFIALAMQCKSVVCCRSTPIQKQQTIEIMRDSIKMRTLAIGDGANDVPMIQTANVGVSVRGNEGMQAVLSSDVAIGEFRFLKRLLFVHGRWCYMRNSFLVVYIIYKGIFVAFIPFWFSLFNQWTGNVYLDPWLRDLWDVVFTAAPIVFFAIFEQDIPAPVLMKYPKLYFDGQRDRFLNFRRFFMWVAFALWDSVVVTFGVLATPFGLSQGVNNDGIVAGQVMAAVVTYTIMVLVGNIHLWIHTRLWTFIIQLSYFLTVIAWFLLGLIYCTSLCIFLNSAPIYWVVENLYQTPLCYVTVVLLSWVCLLPDFLFHYVLRRDFPRAGHLFQEMCSTKEWKASRKQVPNDWCCVRDDCSHRCRRVCCCCRPAN